MPDVPSAQSTTVCARCEGKGTLRTHEDHLGHDGSVIGHTSGTRACPCVRDLPAIDGHATWWELEVVWEKTIRVGYDDVFEVVVTSEVPRMDDGQRVHRKGNRYWPTMIDTHGEVGRSHTADTLREVSAALLAAALAAESIDEPCQDSCGHWSPCDCSNGESR